MRSSISIRWEVASSASLDIPLKNKYTSQRRLPIRASARTPSMRLLVMSVVPPDLSQAVPESTNQLLMV